MAFVPRTPEVIAKLLVQDVRADLADLRRGVEQTLAALQAAGYVARDEANGEYKYLNEKERTIEQEVQRIVRDMGLGPAVRQTKELLKARILTKGRLDQFQIRWGKSQALFGYNVQLDGEDLATLLRRIGRLPPAKGIEIARQLCAGLAAAHERGVLHRDLKPANVMVDGHGRARITDFGLAVAADEAHGFAGTPGYMAPEQLTPGSRLSERTDLYALGACPSLLVTSVRE